MSNKQNIQKKSPKYVPGKTYRWEEDDLFVLSGIEYATLNNTLKEHLERPGGTSIQKLVECQNILMKHLIKGIEEGWITEMEPPKRDNLLNEALNLEGGGN